MALHCEERYTFGALAEAAEFLALYPEGLADSASGWTSWQLETVPGGDACHIYTYTYVCIYIIICTYTCIIIHI
jgi:predicted signal transduction protein with EAL and GGDEF domain